MTDTTKVHSYPGRAELIGGMQPLLKAARRPLAPEWERLGLGDGWHQLHLLAHRLLQRAAQRATAESLRARLNAAGQEISRLRAENATLREHAARHLGQQRTKERGTPPRSSPQR